MTYDGYGRLQTKHAPEQTAGTSTTWTYNNDDSINTVTDARGASTTFTYNNARHLPNVVTHALSGSNTIVESFSYDAAGNRTAMSDSSGGTTYQYNHLSQLTSETRTFAGLSGSYTLGYEYHVSGLLKSLTDHTNQRINYAYDNAGRLNALSGTNYTHGQFINSISYRAWGSPRQIAYGNGRIESVTYNARLRASHYEIPAGGGFGAAVSVDYQYYDDGRLKYSHDLLDNRFDRSYEFDHATRLTKALSGAEARGEPATTDRPYKETATYDAFNHLNVRSSKHWSRVLGFGSSDTYANNRRVGWTYDANGNWLSGAGRQHTYDAAGRTSTTSWTSGGYFNEFFDGDGRRVKTTEPNVVTYYLRSTVLGGQVVEDLNSSGAKQMSFIYAGQKVIGYDWANGNVSMVHEDPSGVTVRSSVTQAPFVTYFSELDPWGAEVFTWDPYLEDPGYGGGRGESGPTYPSFGDISMPSTGCTLDGVYALCDFISRNLNGNGIRTEQLIAEEKPVKQPTIIPKGGQPNPPPVRSLVFVQHDLISFGLGLYGITVMRPGNEGGLDPRDMLVDINELVPQESGQPFLTGALDEAKRRLQENPECAELFGGQEKALKKLNELKFKFGSLDNEGIAGIKGKNVTLDSGRFSARGATLGFATNIRQSTVQGHPSTSFTFKTLTVTGSTFGAFAVLHELGHRSKIYGQYDKDGGSQYTNLPAGANNEKVRAACFRELIPN